MVASIVNKAFEDGCLTNDEIAALFEVQLFSDESARIIAAGRRKAEQACSGLAEVHAQVGLNVAKCPMNCRFCSFAACNEVFAQESELSVEEAVARARQAEAEGANAVYLMITADYPLSRYLEVASEIRRSLRPETPLVANVGDFTLPQAQRLKQVGFVGIYHAVRLGEGRDTSIPVERRLQTMYHAREAGLLIGTCLEPIGPEHGMEELVAKTIITRDARPVYSGAARRIPIPGTAMGQLGIVSKARMAHLVAAVRLVLPRTVPGNCTHEPDVYGAAAGASLLWSEAGANPRDTAPETAGKHGMTTGACREYFSEAGWQVLDGPSRWLTTTAPS
ncbi:MAG: radical SAM protein [Planctomycetota bacterium]|nr:radical SAM protein [Planctomycetota bacterium]